MIQALVHRPREGFSNQVDLENLKPVLEDKAALLWLDVQGPSPEEMELLKREFAFHDLAIEDAMLPHQRPKLDEYDGFYFLVFYALELKGTDLRSAEVDLFFGDNYVVAVHHEPIKEIGEALKLWESSHESLNHGVGSLVYRLLDSLVDGYFVVADTVAERVAGLEERVIKEANKGMVEEVFALKKRLLSIRRILGPERDALIVLMRQDLPLLDRKTVVYLRDVYDHLVRITDTADVYADLLTSLLDVHLSAVSNRLNQVMKVLTSWTIILMTAALIAGVYGMNFKAMPELDWEYGYAYSLGLMAAVGGGLYLYLKRKGWL